MSKADFKSELAELLKRHTVDTPADELDEVLDEAKAHVARVRAIEESTEGLGTTNRGP